MFPYAARGQGITQFALDSSWFNCGSPWFGIDLWGSSPPGNPLAGITSRQCCPIWIGPTSGMMPSWDQCASTYGDQQIYSFQMTFGSWFRKQFRNQMAVQSYPHSVGKWQPGNLAQKALLSFYPEHSVSTINLNWGWFFDVGDSIYLVDDVMMYKNIHQLLNTCMCIHEIARSGYP